MQYTNGHTKAASTHQVGGDMLPPHNHEAEEAVLGSILIDPDAILQVDEFLQAEHFHLVRNGWVYEAMLELAQKAEPIDILTVSDRLRCDGRLDEIGGEARLIGLLEVVPTSVNCQHYGRIVETTAQRRRMINTAGKIASLAWDEAADLNGQMETAENLVLGLRGNLVERGIKRPRQYVREYLDRMEKISKREGEIVGLPTGYMDLDRLTGGLQAPYFYVLAARPGMGKSSLAIAIADHVALKQKKRVALFALEMTTYQTTQRLQAERGRIPLERLVRGQLSPDEWGKVYDMAGEISESNLYIDDSDGLPPGQIRARCRRIAAELGGIDLIIIDHMHMMTADKSTGDRTKDMGDIARSLAYLAKEMNAPVLALAQLNRDLERRQDKRPMLSDLRESGAIEENAHAVMFIYRDEYYNQDLSERPNIAEVNIAKHRDGPTGVIDLYWNGPLASFYNLQRQEIHL